MLKRRSILRPAAGFFVPHVMERETYVTLSDMCRATRYDATPDVVLACVRMLCYAALLVWKPNMGNVPQGCRTIPHDTMLCCTEPCHAAVCRDRTNPQTKTLEFQGSDSVRFVSNLHSEILSLRILSVRTGRPLLLHRLPRPGPPEPQVPLAKVRVGKRGQSVRIRDSASPSGSGSGFGPLGLLVPRFFGSKRLSLNLVFPQGSMDLVSCKTCGPVPRLAKGFHFQGAATRHRCLIPSLSHPVADRGSYPLCGMWPQPSSAARVHVSFTSCGHLSHRGSVERRLHTCAHVRACVRASNTYTGSPRDLGTLPLPPARAPRRQRHHGQRRRGRAGRHRHRAGRGVPSAAAPRPGVCGGRGLGSIDSPSTLLGIVWFRCRFGPQGLKPILNLLPAPGDVCANASVSIGSITLRFRSELPPVWRLRPSLVCLRSGGVRVVARGANGRQAANAPLKLTPSRQKHVPGGQNKFMTKYIVYRSYLDTNTNGNDVEVLVGPARPHSGVGIRETDTKQYGFYAWRGFGN